eukprot:5148240-Prymnesium_polylepis.1
MAQYNEVIVGALYWEERGPRAIDAVFFTQPAAEIQARRIHEAFLARFALNATQVPLLRYTGPWDQQKRGFEDVS